MDGIHDLGGREGFGPVDRQETGTPFHAEWEARLLGIVRAVTRPDDWSGDWFRHCRELIDPTDYLTRPYYDQWLQSYAAMMVHSGVASVAEISSGQAADPLADLPAPMPPAAVEGVRVAGSDFSRDISSPPRFGAGDRVRCRNHGAPGHCRLPLYARGRCGVIESCHGAHVLPDANALGDARAEPLYTVLFAVAELWPDAEDGRDRVSLDLWESYLEPG